jgi:uncharacterized membrane protein YkvA (DUF1232 family)
MFIFSSLLFRVTIINNRSSQENGLAPVNTEEGVLLKILLSNPLIKRSGDEVNQKVLVKWIIQHRKSNDEQITINEIEKLISRLCSLGILSQKECENETYLCANDSYFENKVGEKNQSSKSTKFVTSGGRNKITIRECPVNSEGISYIDDYQNKHNLEYYDILIENIKNYNGPHKDLQLNCPIFFKLLCSILNYRFTDWHTKIMISSSLAYFVLEDDVIPDKEENGYIDDLFIVSYVLKEIMEKSPELIVENWPYHEDIFDLIEDTYQKTSDILGDLSNDVLRKVGLQKFKSLSLEDYSGTYTEKLSKLANERRELLGLVLFLINKMYKTNMRGATIEKIQNMLKDCGDYDEILRLMELAKINHRISTSPKKGSNNNFEEDLEKKLNNARMKALMDD